MFARIYTRVSTEEQAQSGFSLAAQQERLEAFCLSQGWEIADRYIDEGVSAKDLNRPAFQRLMAEAEAGEVVLVYKLDRLTRSVRDLDDLLRAFDARGIRFRSATEQFDTTSATGRLFIRMVAEMAQWERETIAERTAFGKRRKAQEGEWPGGTAPLGYRTAPSEKSRGGRTLLKLVPDPGRSHLIPMIFERYLAGHGVRAIAAWLNTELGVRTPLGCKFHQLTISRILTNPVYCGDLLHGRRTRGPQVRVRATHPPLISREAFDRAQALMAAHKEAPPRQATGAYPLAGVARCGICGGRIDGRRRSGSKGGRVYRCHSYMTGLGCGPAGGRSLASVSAQHAEASVIAAIVRLHQAPPALGALLAEFGARTAESSVTQAEQKRLELDLAEAKSATRRWKRLFEQGQIPGEEYLAEVRPHQERIRQLRAKLAEQQAPAPTGEVLTELDLKEAWAHLEPPERKALLQHFAAAFKAQILLYPDRRAVIRPAR